MNPSARSVDSPTRVDASRAHPLTRAEKLRLYAAAVLTIAGLAGAIALAVLGLTLSVSVLGILMLALARFGISGVLTPAMKRHARLWWFLIRNVWRGRTVELRVPLTQRDAPELFDRLRELATKLDAPVPTEVVLQMNVDAWIHLRGLRRAGRSATLGLGYDLLAGLSQEELTAVLAHEIAHAKFVQRGLKRGLNEVLARGGRMAGALSVTVNAYRRAQEPFEFAESLLRVVDFCLRAAVRQVAALSRQDEFEADLGAAQVCGSAALRSALAQVERLAVHARGISWSERVARLQSGGFGSWLANDLAGAKPTESGRKASGTDSYATHPSMEDRLAALPDDGSSLGTAEPALRWFTDPDAVAARVIEQIQAIIIREEARACAEQQKWLKRARRAKGLGFFGKAGWVMIISGLLVGGILCVAEGWQSGAIVMTGGVIIGVGLLQIRPRLRFELGVPTVEALQAARERVDDPSTREAREAAMRAEIRTQLSAQLGKSKRIAALAAFGREALVACDYLRAYVAARMIRDLDHDAIDGVAISAIASAALGLGPQANGLINTFANRTGLRATTTLWATAWALFLNGEFSGAEAILIDLVERDPKSDTFAALLAICHARCGRTQSAVRCAQRAWTAKSDSALRLDLLVTFLLDAGDARQARHLLDENAALAASRPELVKTRIRLLVIEGKADEAKPLVDELRARNVDGSTWVELGGIFEQGRRPVEADTFYEAALAQGFFPAALAGRARGSVRRGDLAAGRALILQALDSKRTLDPKAVGIGGFFSHVLTLLLETAPRLGEARGWTVTLAGNQVLGPVAGHAMLVFARSAHEAGAFAREVTEAVLPGTAIEANLLTIEQAPADRQPIGVVALGIQSIWRR